MSKKKKAARHALKKDARAGVKRALAAKPARKAKTAKASKGRWTAPGAKDRADRAKRETKTPKQEPLIKGLRIRALDNVCGRISDTRAAIARLQGEEADFERTAHDLMKKHEQMTWQHAGVILARIPGDEKLRVTTVRSRGPAPAATEETEPTQTPERTEAVEELETPPAPGVDSESAEGGLTH
jgi:hypothetical protein